MNDYTNVTRENLENKDYINWENWDRVVEETKIKIAKALKNFTPINKTGKLVYAYNDEGKLYKIYQTIKAVTIDIPGGTESTVSRYVKVQEIYQGYLLTPTELTTEQAKQMYKDKLTKGKCFFANNTKHSQRVYKYNSEGKLIGAYESLSSFKKHGGIQFTQDRLLHGNLISRNYYHLYTAQEIYKKLFQKFGN